ncbi:MAG: heavy metal translocating P-type ATPase metal-binding domain-containing protein [Bacteroidetes bacterium]|nr:heavy metal translocating P-type ATPase metal-binding domain-containing protein [Bacteroidota bacterium]
MNRTETKTKIKCYHCGDDCDVTTIVSGDKYFCCNGCKSVFDILNKNDLCDYYTLNATPGESRKNASSKEKFAFLDNKEIAAEYLEFATSKEIRVRFYLPHIHCSSCIWLLENLHTINSGIQFSRVEFERKEIIISLNPEQFSIRDAAELLANIGYEPYFAPREKEEKKDTREQRNRIVKIGIAGFCFANIMLLSFPEYLGFESLTKDGLSPVIFRILNLALSIPVLFYSGSEFFRNALLSYRQKVLNIDAPIALALAVTFVRSVYEVISNTGSGYFDSLSGIIFFMLVGRAFQNKTYKTLKFNRDFTSYFPIAVCVKSDESENYKRIQDVQKDDVIVIHSNEIIPVDGIVLRGKAELDYGFITGENDIHPVGIGGIAYAGGRQKSGNVELLVIKPFSQGKFTRLWNEEVFRKQEKDSFSFVTIISKYFSFAVISLAIIAFVFWQFENASLAWKALTSVLIVACPCALLLANTFTEGFVLNIFSRNGFYLKNGTVLQGLFRANKIVFDKTGTLTIPAESHVEYLGKAFEPQQRLVLAGMFAQSLHPLSRAISNYFHISGYSLEHFKELENGMEAWFNDNHYRVGSADFAGATGAAGNGSEVWVSVNNHVFGKFEVSNVLRKNIGNMIAALEPEITVLSGDNSFARASLEKEIPRRMEYRFKQNPEDKFHYVNALKSEGYDVMMVGDGLNDAGALRSANTGIAVVENTVQFSPACEGILLAEKLSEFHHFIKAAKQSRNLIIFTFIISVCYNVVGLYFSVTAQLSPLIAAVLMPLSTISIVLATMLGSGFIENFTIKNNKKKS